MEAPTLFQNAPKILTLGLNEKIVPMVECLRTLGTEPHEVTSAITKFAHILWTFLLVLSPESVRSSASGCELPGNIK
ncbi:hypothetical protein PIB30_024284 [Stylosanthes scabra]|uniref:Uncharacterized protein n=1 Tax=Stylosanthes scabra TaxID=79078 RepID=A0ABU6W844_9FABA|nr:hypothetical protein [Stylosanthes scabra]